MNKQITFGIEQDRQRTIIASIKEHATNISRIQANIKHGLYNEM